MDIYRVFLVGVSENVFKDLEESLTTHHLLYSAEWGKMPQGLPKIAVSGKT